MAAQRWVITLLRARTAREDLAKQRLGKARRQEQLAAAHAASERRRASLVVDSTTLSTTAFLAASAAGQAAAATADQAAKLMVEAQSVTAQSMAELIEAARGRRTAEEMLERQTAADKANAKLSAERELDEIAARTFTPVGRIPRGLQ